MRKNILVVDDEPDLRNLLSTVLEKAGYKVSTAVDGDDCLEQLQEITPDLLLMDVMMPGTPVKKIVKQIKKTKIAYLSIVKTSDIEKEELLEQENVVDYIQKPFDVDELLSKIQYLTRGRRIKIEEEIKNLRNALLIIPPEEYSTIVSHCISQLSNKPLCYITFNKSALSLKEFLHWKKINTSEMYFIDGITKTMIKNPKKEKNIHYTSNPGNLSELKSIINQIIDKNVKYLVFDSVTDVLTYNGIDTVRNFIDELTYYLIKKQCKGIFYSVSRYQYTRGDNRLSSFIYTNNLIEKYEPMIEEKLFSMDMVIDLRKKQLDNIF